MGYAGRLLGTTALCAATMAFPAHFLAGKAEAQTAMSQLDEIVVTGQRREETLRDAPVAVTVFSEAQLREANVDRPGDFLQLTPSVTFVQSNIPGEAYITIRGNTQIRVGDASTALVIDGVQSLGQNNINQEFAALEQIEVLKGPQGALYGRNAIGGAVVIRTKTPNMVEYEGEVEAGFGNLSSVSGKGYISGPIIEDELAFTASFSYEDNDGGYVNIFTNEEPHRFNEQTANGRLFWTPDEALTVDVKLRWTKMKGGGIGWNALLTDEFSPPGGALETVFGLFPNVDEVDGDNTSIPFEANIPGFSENERRTASAKIDYTFDDVGTVTLVGAYEFIRDFYGADSFPYRFTGGFPIAGNGLPPGGETQSTFRRNEIFQIEGRFQSEFDGPFNFIVGGQAAWFDLTRETNTGLDTGPVEGFFIDTRGVNLGRAPNPRGSLNQTIGYLAGEEDNSFFGIFANFFYEPTDRLSFTASFRYDRESKDQQNFVGCDPAAPGEVIISAAVFCDFQLEQNILLPTYVRRPGATRQATFDQFQPRISAKYDVTDEVSVYASYAIGFKTGGFNPFGTRALLTAFNPATTIGDIFPKEKAVNYELGAKSEWLDGRLRINGAVFFTQTDNSQLLEFRPEATLEAISTADEVDMFGIEADFQAAVTDYFSLSGGFGYLDTEIKAFTGAPQNVGGQRPQTSDWTANLAGTAVVPLVGEYEMVGRLDWRYQGKTYWDWGNTEGSARSGFSLVNLRVAVGNGSWELAGFANNLLDYRYNSEIIPILPGLVDANYRAPPRRYGFELSYRW